MDIFNLLVDKNKSKDSIQKEPEQEVEMVSQPEVDNSINLLENTSPTQHDHQYDLVLKTYAPPKPEYLKEGLSESIVEKLLFGITMLLWRCVICNNSKKEEIIGTDENQLEETLNKVLKFGPQYIQKEGTTFVIGKWQPPTPSTNNLPLR